MYLEIIAPDPTQPPPEQPRPFSLDEPSTHDQIIAYAVHPVAKEGATIELLSATMRLAGYDPGPIASMSRLKPDGGELRWRLTPLAKAVGPRPWIIDWGQTTHPATTTTWYRRHFTHTEPCQHITTTAAIAMIGVP